MAKYVRMFYNFIFNTETSVWEESSAKVQYEHPELFKTPKEKVFVAEGHNIVDVIKVGDVIAEENTGILEVVDELLLECLQKNKNNVRIIEIWFRRDNTMSLIWSKERDSKLTKGRVVLKCSE